MSMTPIEDAWKVAHCASAGAPMDSRGRLESMSEILGIGQPGTSGTIAKDGGGVAVTARETLRVEPARLSR